MPTQSPTETALRAENEDLRARLEETEETLRAIRSGEVDALVVEGPTGTQIYSLQSAEAESNRFRGDILTQINDVVIATDLEQRITYFNTVAERLYHVRADDVLGHHIDEVYTKQWPNAEAEAARLAALYEQGKWCGELVQCTNDGRKLNVAVSVCILRDQVGTDIGLLAVIRDVTERKINERLLAESQQRYAGIVNSAMDAIVTVDSNYTILVFNPAAEFMFGCTAKEAIGGSLNRFIPEQLRHAHDSHIRSFGRSTHSSRKMAPVGRGVIGLRANGEEFPIEVSISHSGTEGAKLFTAILRDISERIRAETILKEQLKLQDKITKIAASVPGLICSFRVRPDGSSHMPYASPAVESVLGLSAEAIAENSSPLFARIHPDDIGRVNETTTLSARSLTTWLGLFRYLHPSKGEIWLEGQSIPQQEADGSIVWQGYIQDVTERIRSEQEIQNRENVLRTIMDAAPALLSYLDVDFRYLRVNKTYENWFCIHKENILGHTAREIIGEKAWVIAQPYLERARSGERVSFDYQIPYGTSKSRWVHGNYIPDKDANGTVKGIVVHVTDIEDIKKAVLALEESERQNRFLADILAHADQPFAVGKPDGRLEYVNPAFERLTGYSHDELLMMDWATGLTPPEWQAFEQAKLEEIQRNQQAIRYEKEYSRKDGSRVPIELLVQVMSDEAGQPIHYNAFITNLTERKQAEAMLRDSEDRMRLATEATGVGIWEWNVITNQLRWDAQMFRIYGIAPTRDGFVDHSTWINCVLLEDQPYQETLIRDTVKSGQSTREFRILRADVKEIRTIQAAAKVRKNNSGQLEWVIVGTNIDITHLKQATQAVQAHKERLTLGMQVAGLALAEVDYATGLNHLSAEAAKLYGLGEAEIVVPRATVHATFHPDDRKELMRRINISLDPKGNSFAMDHRVLWPDNSLHWLRVRKKVFFSGKGKARHPTSATLAIHDITSEKKAAEAVLASEAFVRAVLNSLPEQVVVLDLNGVVTAVNEPWERFAVENNATPHCVSKGANYLEVCRTSSATGDPYAQQALEGLEALLSGQDQDFVMEYPCPSPTLDRWFLMHAKRAGQGLKGVILSHIDITERKHAEDELNKTQLRLGLAIEELKAGYWEWDLINQSLYLSPEWKRQLGFDDTELDTLWSQKDDRLHPDDFTNVTEATEKFIAGRQPTFELQFRLRHKDGTYRWIHSRGALLRDKDGKPYRMLGLNLDITDYLDTRELNEQRNAMERSFRLYVATQTAAAIAHELNQPLTAISYYAYVAQNLLEIGNQDPQKLVKIMEKCGQQAQRAGEVIKQLLALLHKGETISEPIDVNKSVQYALTLVKASAYLDTYIIGLNLADGLPQVMANELQVQKVLVNLLNNALESMQESGNNSGTITVTTYRSPNDPSKAHVTVCDNGMGVTDIHKLKQMFQPFSSSKATGLGMGLAISHALVEAHGGKMWAEQNPDKGISVHFTLPFVL